MKFITVDASKSINPNTGESWYRAEVKVSVDENENPEQVFRELKSKLDDWLPNPFEKKVTVVDKAGDDEIEKAFQEVKTRIASATTKAAAGQILLDSEFKLNIELKQLVNNKPE